MVPLLNEREESLRKCEQSVKSLSAANAAWAAGAMKPAPTINVQPAPVVIERPRSTHCTVNTVGVNPTIDCY